MNKIPEGYAKNSVGHLVAVETIAQIDKDRDELVRKIIKRAEEARHILTQLKIDAMSDINEFVENAGKQYKVKMGGIKGNLSLTSFDGEHMVKVCVSDRTVFDERLQVAKELVDKCIHKWSAGSRPELKSLIEHAFQTDREGKINTARVLELTRLSIHDADWKRAMQAVRDSIQVVGNTQYLRIYKRNSTGERYDQISLDIAGV
jgi:hypothetical protein